MLPLDVLSRIIHVGTVITLIGGSAFTLFVLMPSARQLTDEAHDKLAAAVQSRWKRWAEPSSRPHTAVFHPDGRHAVATMQDSDQIAVLDLLTMNVIRTYPTGGREGHMVRLSPDGSRARSRSPNRERGSTVSCSTSRREGAVGNLS